MVRRKGARTREGTHAVETPTRGWMEAFFTGYLPLLSSLVSCVCVCVCNRSEEPVPRRSAPGASRLITAVWQHLLGYQYQTRGTMEDNGARRNTVPDKRDNMHEIAHRRRRRRASVTALSHARPPVSDAMRRRGDSGNKLLFGLCGTFFFCELWNKSREIKNSQALHQFYCDRTIMKLLLSLAPRPRVLVTLLRAVISAGGNKKKNNITITSAGTHLLLWALPIMFSKRGDFRIQLVGNVSSDR